MSGTVFISYPLKLTAIFAPIALQHFHVSKLVLKIQNVTNLIRNVKFLNLKRFAQRLKKDI